MLERITGAEQLLRQWMDDILPADADDGDDGDLQLKVARSLAAEEVEAHEADAVAPDRRDRERANAERIGGQAQIARSVDGLERIAILVEHYAEWLAEISREIGYPQPHAVMASTLLARRSSVTTRAIALLLSRGYTQDALGRWRSLFELASTAALLARPGDSELAYRYLVHASVFADSSFPTGYEELPYEWARPYFAATRDEQRRRITQTMIFRAADLALVDYPESVGAAHGATHLDSYVVGRLTNDVPGAPYGFDQGLSTELCDLSVNCLYEAVTACAYLATSDMPGRASLRSVFANAEWVGVIRSWIAAFPRRPESLDARWP